MDIITQNFAYIFLTFLLADYAWHLYLSWRQEKSILNHRVQVPSVFANNISLEEHQKAADYTLTKQRFGRFETTIGLFVIYLFTVQGGLAWVNKIVQNLSFTGFSADLALLVFYGGISFILNLPFSIYSTFVIEKKFGFNKTTAKLFITDSIKSILISIVIGIPLLWIILLMMDLFLDSLWWLWVGLFILFIQLIMIWVYPLFIAPMFNKFSPLEDEELKIKIANLAQKCGFKATDIQVMDGSKRSSHGNAYFTGFGKAKKIVFFDTLLEKLNHNQVIAVLAHELGHFALKHIVKRFIPGIIMIFASLWLLDFLIKSPWFYTAFHIENSSHLLSLLLFSLVLPPFISILSPIMSASSRKHEFEADAYASEHSNAQHLIDALLALYRDNAATLTPDLLYSKWHDSHPPATLRIGALQKLI